MKLLITVRFSPSNCAASESVGPSCKDKERHPSTNSHVESSNFLLSGLLKCFCTYDAFHINNSIRCFWASVCVFFTCPTFLLSLQLFIQFTNGNLQLNIFESGSLQWQLSNFPIRCVAGTSDIFFTWQVGSFLAWAMVPRLLCTRLGPVVPWDCLQFTNDGCSLLHGLCGHYLYCSCHLSPVTCGHYLCAPVRASWCTPSCHFACSSSCFLVGCLVPFFVLQFVLFRVPLRAVSCAPVRAFSCAPSCRFVCSSSCFFLCSFVPFCVLQFMLFGVLLRAILHAPVRAFWCTPSCHFACSSSCFLVVCLVPFFFVLHVVLFRLPLRAILCAPVRAFWCTPSCHFACSYWCLASLSFCQLVGRSFFRHTSAWVKIKKLVLLRAPFCFLCFFFCACFKKEY